MRDAKAEDEKVAPKAMAQFIGNGGDGDADNYRSKQRRQQQHAEEPHVRNHVEKRTL